MERSNRIANRTSSRVWPIEGRPAPRHEVDQEYQEKKEPMTEKRRTEGVDRVARTRNRKCSTSQREWEGEEGERGGEGEAENDY